MAKHKRKNPAAVALARKRWKGVTQLERSRLMRAAIQKRWDAKKRLEESAKDSAA